MDAFRKPSRVIRGRWPGAPSILLAGPLALVMIMPAVARAPVLAGNDATGAPVAAVQEVQRRTASRAATAGPAPSGPPAEAAGPGDDAPVLPVSRAFGDVVVACDNGLHCEVVGVGNGDFGLSLRLSREAGGRGAVALALVQPEGVVAPAALRLDGARVPALAALPWRAEDQGTRIVLGDPGAITAAIDLLRNGDRLVSGDSERGFGMSLTGLSAALLFVDEHQGRLGTRGAWRQRGTRSESTVRQQPALPRLPPAPAAPLPLTDDAASALTARVRAAQASVLQAVDCNPRDASRGFDIARDDAAFALDADRALVLVTCWSGAYQSSAVAFVAPRSGDGAATRLRLPLPPGVAEGDQPSGVATLDTITSGNYDPASAMLTHFAKGRGLADCGVAAQWRFDGERFVPASYVELRRCGGGAPGNWPVLWRTRDD